jgi:hypothetical protein
MRIVAIGVAGLSLLAACQKAEAPDPATRPLASVGAETGSDEPGAPFSPAAVGAAQAYLGLSKTAMSLTGDLSLTPTTQTGPNMPPGATFTFARGMALTTTLMPGGATYGATPYDWKAAFSSQRPLALDKIAMYSVETETPAPSAKTGSICDKTRFIATYLDDGGTPAASDDMLMLAAFSSDDWPPSKPDTALCATFIYSPATR